MRLHELANNNDTLNTLYVSRPLKNGTAFAKWAVDAGLKEVLDPSELHVTIAYSKLPVDWDLTQPAKDTIRCNDGERTFDLFGKEKNVVVLRFKDEALDERWTYLCDEVGCSWDHDRYHPHVTITYSGEGVDLDKIEPYRGTLVFGPEEFEPIDEDYKDKIKTVDDSE